jgi:hypothetical protein
MSDLVAYTATGPKGSRDAYKKVCLSNHDGGPCKSLMSRWTSGGGLRQSRKEAGVPLHS